MGFKIIEYLSGCFARNRNFSQDHIGKAFAGQFLLFQPLVSRLRQRDGRSCHTQRLHNPMIVRKCVHRQFHPEIIIGIVINIAVGLDPLRQSRMKTS
jgi:hypothetical protein